MDDDLLDPDDGETEEEHLEADVGRDLDLERDPDEGLRGEEHIGLTPPG